MRATLKALIASLPLAASLSPAAQAAPPAWAGYARDAQHSAQSSVASQTLARIHWQVAVDLSPTLSGGELLIHYASPMITAANTVLVPVKTTAAGDFRIEARNGVTGALLYSLPSSFVLPSAGWTPVYPATLTPQNRLYYAQAGGVLAWRDSPDSATGKSGTVDAFNNASVQINTPLTADAKGNVYFGFLVGTPSGGLANGIARVAPDGSSQWVTTTAASGDSSMTSVAMNAAPAISHDGKLVYVAVTSGFSGALLALDSTTLTLQGKAALIDPHSKQAAWLINESSASPTVGPNNDVFFGVLENPFSHHDRGWLLHFSRLLAKRKIPGAFGWDDTVAVVPSAALGGYGGTSSYLLFTKYNNYIEAGGDGRNMIALLDPAATQPDSIDPGVKVMKEAATLLGQTPFPGQAGSYYEWCINSAAVDPQTRSVLANSEDGRLYRWNLATGAVAESITLNSPRPEAYTPTLIGPDGQVFAINNGTLYAVGK